MDEKKSQIKLFTWKHTIWAGVAVIAGIGLGVYMIYSEKGYLTKVEITSIIVATVLTITLISGVAYYANRPEKGE